MPAEGKVASNHPPMKILLPFLALILAATTAARAEELDPAQFESEKTVVILGCYKAFAPAQKEAQDVARRSGLPFSLRGMKFDRKRGLILPDNDPDPTYAGSYVARRYNAESDEQKAGYLSVERSDAYPGFASGLYMVVAGIYDDPKEAAAAVARFKQFIPSAYAKRTKIYMGCMH